MEGCAISCFTVFQTLKCIRDYYNFGAVIGSGRTGTVHVGNDRVRGDIVAIKCGEKSRMSARKLALYRLRNTSLLSLTQSNESLVGVHDIFETITRIYIVSELQSGGCVPVANMDDCIAKRIISNVLHALQALHNEGFAHGEIAERKVLVAGKAQNLEVKLAAIGCAHFVQHSDEFVKDVRDTGELLRRLGARCEYSEERDEVVAIMTAQNPPPIHRLLELPYFGTVTDPRDIKEFHGERLRAK